MVNFFTAGTTAFCKWSKLDYVRSYPVFLQFSRKHSVRDPIPINTIVLASKLCMLKCYYSNCMCKNLVAQIFNRQHIVRDANLIQIVLDNKLCIFKSHYSNFVRKCCYSNSFLPTDCAWCKLYYPNLVIQLFLVSRLCVVQVLIFQLCVQIQIFKQIVQFLLFKICVYKSRYSNISCQQFVCSANPVQIVCSDPGLITCSNPDQIVRSNPVFQILCSYPVTIQRCRISIQSFLYHARQRNSHFYSTISCQQIVCSANPVIQLACSNPVQIVCSNPVFQILCSDHVILRWRMSVQSLLYRARQRNSHFYIVQSIQHCNSLYNSTEDYRHCFTFQLNCYKFNCYLTSTNTSRYKEIFSNPGLFCIKYIIIDIYFYFINLNFPGCGGIPIQVCFRISIQIISFNCYKIIHTKISAK